MSSRDVVQVTIDVFGRDAGFTKKSGAWYLSQAEKIAVVQLQKSQYGRWYYVNVGLWLLALGDAGYPKERACHVRTRLEVLFGDQEHRLKVLLDLESPMDDAGRRAELMELLTRRLLPLLRASSTIAGLVSGEGQVLINRSLVTGPGQRLLQGQSA